MRQMLKRILRSFLYRRGYEMRPIPPSAWRPDWEAALTVKESQYYTQWFAPCPFFTPWVGHPEFQTIYEGVSQHTLVSPDRCYILSSLARYASHLSGDFAECGVYKGGTALLFCRILGDKKKTLFLFDSFEGLPEVNKEYDTHYGKGEFSDTSSESVKEVLKEFRHCIDLRKGWIPATFDGLANKQFAFAHIDVDLFQSALDCCEYFYPRLVSGGVMIFDEYGFAMTRGEKDAVDRFFRDKPESPFVLPTGQAVVIKLPTLSKRQ